VRSPETLRAQQQKVVAAAGILWEHWQSGRRLAALPEEFRPETREEGYDIQSRLEAHSDLPLFGWKIAATSVAGQKHINVDGPLAGRLLAERVSQDGARLPFGANHMRVAEAEFAFRMVRTLAPREQPYDVMEVLDAVGTLHPSIEVPDSRFDDFTIVGAPQLIADNACAHLFVVGPATTADWRGIDLVQHAVSGTVLGKTTHHGKGANVLGDPRIALTWLANELSQLGIPLGAGQVVTTGTCIVPLPIEPGDSVEMDFGVLGRVGCELSD
jgi:2-keto-4-pentenoate hydratase